MKKFILGAAALPLLAMLATSCAQETVETKGDEAKLLTYGTAMGKQTLTRVAETTNDNIGGMSAVENIPVWPFYTDDDTAFEIPKLSLEYVSPSTEPLWEGMWTYNGLAKPLFHPNRQLIHFSVYPDPENNTANDITQFTFTPDAENEDALLEFTVPAVGSQVDLIAATPYKTTNTSTNHQAQLTFSHLLSQVNFAVRAPEGLTVTITDLTVKNVANEGVFTVNAAVAVPASVWASVTGSANYVYDTGSGFATSPLLADNTIQHIGYEPGNTSKVNALMLMPQEFAQNDAPLVTPANNTTVPHFSFHFKMEQVNAGDPSTPVTIVVDEGDAYIPLGHSAVATANGGWDKGKRYLYVINFEAPYRITYDVGVGAWENADPENVDLDNNEDGDEEGSVDSPAYDSPGQNEFGEDEVGMNDFIVRP